MSVSNPWVKLPENPPFVLAEGAEIIERHNSRQDPRSRFQLAALPEPSLGPQDAPVVLLNLNPGFDPSDLTNYATPMRSAMMRRSLTHDLSPERAFYFLTDSFEGTGGWYWWSAKLKPVIREVGVDRVRRGVRVIEDFPYKSTKFNGFRRLLPSHEYSFYLADQAVRRGATVVAMRSHKSWLAAVPSFADTSFHVLNSPQNVTVSPRNCPTGFSELVEKLERFS